MFFTGQRIVCVNDANWPGGYRGRVIFPVRGQIYTVRAIASRRREGWSEDGLFLVEIRNLRLRLLTFSGARVRCEVAFRMSRFRPVRTTNIDIFTAMLAPAPRDLVDA